MRDLHQIMKDIQPYMKFIFEHEDEFLKEFMKTTGGEIIDISFGSDEVKFVCCLESGQHIQDAITIDDFIPWMRKVRGEYP